MLIDSLRGKPCQGRSCGLLLLMVFDVWRCAHCGAVSIWCAHWWSENWMFDCIYMYICIWEKGDSNIVPTTWIQPARHGDIPHFPGQPLSSTCRLLKTSKLWACCSFRCQKARLPVPRYDLGINPAVTQYGRSPHITSTQHTIHTAPEWRFGQAEQTPASGKTLLTPEKHIVVRGLRTFPVNLVTRSNRLKEKGSPVARQRRLTTHPADIPLGTSSQCIGHGTEHSLFPHECLWLCHDSQTEEIHSADLRME